MSGVMHRVTSCVSLTVLLITVTTALPMASDDNEVISAKKSECNPYSYCEGESFPRSMEIEGRRVMCDVAPPLKKNCCLPNAYHMVCYNLKVEGSMLNFLGHSSTAEQKQSHSTMINELCDALLTSQGHERGKYIGMLMGDGPGRLVYRYGKWTSLDDGATVPTHRHIKHLACSTKPKAKLP